MGVKGLTLLKLTAWLFNRVKDIVGQCLKLQIQFQDGMEGTEEKDPRDRED